MKKLIVAFLIVVSSVAFAEGQDSTLVKKYELKMNLQSNALQLRIQKLIAEDAECNQLKGSIKTLDMLKKEELQRLKRENK